MPRQLRDHPNIAISGVPGTGKTTLAQRLRFRYPHMKCIDMGKEAEERDCREEYDDLLQTWVVDEDRLVSELAPNMATGGNIIDWIHADMWSTSSSAPLVDLVITLHTNNTLLYDRLKARKYPDLKISQNIDAEIMDEIGSENAEAFGAAGTEGGEGRGTGGSDGLGLTTLVQLRSDTEEDAEGNVENIGKWITKWATTGDGGRTAVPWLPPVRVSSNGPPTVLSGTQPGQAL